MGKTPKPLKILVADSLLPWPELDKMAEQGHEVWTFKDLDARIEAENYAWGDKAPMLSSFDIILSPNAHYMAEEMKKYLPVAVKAARGRKYAKRNK